MEFDNSWGALLNPGDASVYFDALPLPDFERSGARFSPRSSYIYAEISRIIYNDSTIARRNALKLIGWREVQFISAKDVQCAVLTDGRELIIVHRGSTRFDDWSKNFNAFLEDWEPGGRVHRGFKESFDMVKDDLLPLIQTLGMPIKGLCGHSKGAGEAFPLASYLDRIEGREFEVYTYGAPPPGDAEFARTIRQPVHRVVFDQDAVGNLTLPGYEHCGRLTRLAASVESEQEARDIPIKRWFNFSWMPAPRRLRSHTPVNYVAMSERYL